MLTIRVVQENKCIGCELCVIESQHQLKRVGFQGSYIRILRDPKKGDVFEVSLDPKIAELKSKKIVEVCPRGVFEETEENGA